LEKVEEVEKVREDSSKFESYLELLAISNYKFSAFLTAKATVIKAGLDICVHFELLAISN